MKTFLCGVVSWMLTASVSAQDIAEGLKDAMRTTSPNLYMI